MKLEEIRNILQQEYERQKEDTNQNFLSRFAKAIFEAQNRQNIHYYLISFLGKGKEGILNTEV